MDERELSAGSESPVVIEPVALVLRSYSSFATPHYLPPIYSTTSALIRRSVVLVCIDTTVGGRERSGMWRRERGGGGCARGFQKLWIASLCVSFCARFCVRSYFLMILRWVSILIWRLVKVEMTLANTPALFSVNTDNVNSCFILT